MVFSPSAPHSTPIRNPRRWNGNHLNRCDYDQQQASFGVMFSLSCTTLGYSCWLYVVAVSYYCRCYYCCFGGCSCCCYRKT